jgi:hypothetical protein
MNKQTTLLIATASTLAVAGAFFMGSTLASYNTNTYWEQKLLREGYGEYNKKTGDWQLCEPEVVLLNHNTTAINILNGGTVTIKDYLTIVESDLKKTQDKLEEQTKELLDQDLLIEKYKKHIKLPPESTASTKGAKRPLEKIDVTKPF